MNLLEALEKKRALQKIIQENTEHISNVLKNQEKLTSLLIYIDTLIENYFKLERSIQKKYETTMVSSTESISDLITYTDEINKKLEILKYLLLSVTKNNILSKDESKIDTNTILLSIRQYEELRNILIKKVKDVCLNTSLNNT